MEPRHSSEEMRRRMLPFYLSPQAQSILDMARNDKASSRSFAEVISAEPLFAARLLRVINIASGLSHRIATMTQALNLFGLDNLKALALGLSAFALPVRLGPEKNFHEQSLAPLRDLWEHSLGCAAVAGRLATRLEIAPLPVFTAGFIHDVGRVLLYRAAPENFLEATRMSGEKSIPVTEAEILALGLSHAAAGDEWASRSDLPEFFRSVLRLHHERPAMLPGDLDLEQRRCVLLLQASDSIGHVARIGGADERAEPGREVWTELGLERHEWAEQAAAVKNEISAARAIFGLAKPVVEPPAERQRATRESKVATVGAGRGTVIPFPSRGEPPAPPPPVLDPATKLSILVVEDHNSLCDLLSLYLMRHGYHVRTASNGEGALDILAKEEIHLVLLDLMLPRVDGFEVLRHVHNSARPRQPYIIVVSAGASERDRKKVLELGADEYMPKPFHLMRLLERIQVIEKDLR